MSVLELVKIDTPLYFFQVPLRTTPLIISLDRQGKLTKKFWAKSEDLSYFLGQYLSPFDFSDVLIIIHVSLTS